MPARFEEQALHALAAKVQQLNWRRLRLENFCASEQRTELFLHGLLADTFETTRPSLMNPDGTDNSICPSVTLPEDWDRYLETKVSSNTRQKIRRFLRQVESSETSRITHANADTVARDMDLLLMLWTQRWAGQKGKRLQAILNADRRALRQAFAAGTLFMPVLWQGDRAICVFAFLIDDRKKTSNFYIGGRDEGVKGPPVKDSCCTPTPSGTPSPTALPSTIFCAATSPTSPLVRLRGAARPIALRDHEGPSEISAASSTPEAFRWSSGARSNCNRRTASSEAERAGLIVYDVDPHHAKALHLLGTVAAKRGDHVTAVKQFRLLVSLRPDVVTTWYELGKSLQVRKAPGQKRRMPTVSLSAGRPRIPRSIAISDRSC